MGNRDVAQGENLVPGLAAHENWFSSVQGTSQVAEVRRGYRPELDGLRFFAFLAVFVNHTVLFGDQGSHKHLPGPIADLLGTIGYAGAFGVDLFFVLSAFLITNLLLRERDRMGELDIRAFYARRALRIWPLYFIYISFALLLTAVMPSEQFSWKYWLAFALFSGNWLYMAHPITTIAAPLWSVSVEEQFYLLWPWLVRRANAQRLVVMAALLLVVELGLRGYLAAGEADGWIIKGSLTRVDGIAVGVILAVVMRDPSLAAWLQRWRGRERAMTVLLAIFALLWIMHGLRLAQPHPGVIAQMFGWPLAALACGAMVAAVLGGAGPVGRALQWAPLVYLGRISYGLYVFHELSLLIADHCFPNFSQRSAAWVDHWFLALGLTVGFAALSYRYIEKPFLVLKQQRYTIVASRPE